MYSRASGCRLRQNALFSACCTELEKSFSVNSAITLSLVHPLKKVSLDEFGGNSGRVTLMECIAISGISFFGGVFG